MQYYKVFVVYGLNSVYDRRRKNWSRRYLRFLWAVNYAMEIGIRPCVFVCLACRLFVMFGCTLEYNFHNCY